MSHQVRPTTLVVSLPKRQSEVMVASATKEAQISDPVIKCQSQTIMLTMSAEACYSDIQDEAVLSHDRDCQKLSVIANHIMCPAICATFV